jgi:hypothetical protein
VTVIDRVFARHHTATARFKPTQIGGCVLWLDMLERDSYVVTPRSGDTPDTVQSITNLASGVAWTEATNPPIFDLDGLGGRPCLTNPLNGIRRLISAEAAVVSPFTAQNSPFTIVMACQPVFVNGNLFSIADSGINSGAQSINVQTTSSGLYRITRIDDTLATVAQNVHRFTQPKPQVFAWRFDGSEVAGWRDFETTASPAAVAFTQANPYTTVDRTGIFCRPDASPDTFGFGRFGAVALFAGSLSDADLLLVRMWMAAKWLRGIAPPSGIANRTNWLDDFVSITGGNVAFWVQRQSGNNWTAPAGKEPSVDITLPSGSMKFVPANSDCLAESTAAATGAITIALQFKLDALPAPAGSFMLASPRMGSDKWFQIMAANALSGWNDYSFGFQNGLVSQQMFGIDGKVLDGGVHRMIVTYDGTGTSPSDYQCMFDGAFQTITNSGTKSRTTGDKGSLGAQVSSADVAANVLDGRLFKFATFDRVLTAPELASLDDWLSDGWAQSPANYSSCVAWIDLLEPASHGTFGEGPAARTNWVKNLISGVIWEELTSPPQYVLIDGMPYIKGNGSNAHITTTEPAVCAALSGTDNAYTVIMVVQPEIDLAEADAYVGFGHSARNPLAQSAAWCGTNAGDGQWTLQEWDDAFTQATVKSNACAIKQRQVISFVCSGTTANIYINDATAASMVSTTANNGTNTLNMVSLLRAPGSVPGLYTAGHVGSVLIFNAALSDADRLGFAKQLMAKWSIGFNPQSIASLKAWFKLSETPYRTVTGGSPETVTALRNLASGVLWNTLASAFPEYEATAFNGGPCMRGGSTLLGSSTNRGLISTEAALVTLFSGEDKAYTIMEATEPMGLTPAGYQATFGYGNSGVANNNTGFVGRRVTNGRFRMELDDDAAPGLAPAAERGLDIAAGPQVVCYIDHGITASMFVGTETTPNPNGSGYNAGVITPNQSAFFCRPDSAPDLFSIDRLAEFLLFDGVITELDRTRVRDYLRTEHGIAA